METTSYKKIVKISLLVALFLFITIFAFVKSRNIIFGVKIKNVNIVSGTKVTDSIQKITGNAKNAVKLTLNDREISVNQQGDFDETIALFSGYNIITLKAQDKFGNKDEKDYQLIY